MLSGGSPLKDVKQIHPSYRIFYSFMVKYYIPLRKDREFMRRLFSYFLIIAVLFSVLLTGCNTSSSDGPVTPSDELVIDDHHSDDGRSVVGISMPSQSLERWNRDGLFFKTCLLEPEF